MQSGPDQVRVPEYVSITQFVALIQREQFGVALCATQKLSTDARQRVAPSYGVPGMTIRICIDTLRWLGHDELPARIDEPRVL